MRQKILKFNLVILATMISMCTWAVEVEVDGLWYEVVAKAKYASVIMYKDNAYSGGVVIPEKITYDGEEYPVKRIENNAFNNCRFLTSITIPSSMTSIGDAFRWCDNLKSVYISNLETWCNIFTGTDLWSNPLNSCPKLYLNGELLKDLVIPNSVTSIGVGAFYHCEDIISVTIPNTVTSIGGSAFYGCKCLSTVTIPNSVISLGGNAFGGCSNLISISIPNSVTSIKTNTFNNCSSLVSISIPNSVTNIGESAFERCSSLTSISIPNSVTGIESYAFYGCIYEA